MVAFHNSNELKERCLDLVYRGRWNNYSEIHNLVSQGRFSMSKQYGIPLSLGSIGQEIERLLTGKEHDNFNVQYVENIEVGQDLNKTVLKFIYTVLSSELAEYGLGALECRRKIKQAISQIAEYYHCLAQADYGSRPNLTEAEKVLTCFALPRKGEPMIKEVKVLLPIINCDPMCNAALAALKILNHYCSREGKFEDSLNNTNLIENFIRYVDNAWEGLGVKDRGILLRDILFKCIAEEAQLPTV